ncbi:MAG: NADH-quinone oxidoreductase subunit J [Desulfobacterales bacterium]
MNLYASIFYALAVLILASTTMAVTRRNLVHAVLYLVFSFFGSALLFYLLGAPLLAMLEVIIYAGAIMILFLFIVMMLRDERGTEPLFRARHWVPAAAMAAGYLVVMLLLGAAGPEGEPPMEAASASPAAFGKFLVEQHWLSIEIVSFLLLVALIGALHLGRRKLGGTPGGASNP